ncbi:MAG: 1-acyl-sn-glycerol-3-phosphate acyltransferase [Cyclobacteriaceae bacterium]|jgi:1-acyl-sn-glycerol-3-phosphate acyltransferase|nr:1-acyl-sn-glycerol-3-phosphate acyltransferase [Cyclobacteriaceae bacterium]
MKLIGLFFRGLYTGYACFVFVILFLLLFPFFLIPIFFPTLHKLTGVLNRIWAVLYFALLAMPFFVKKESKLNSKQYVFVANHFSYFDIAVMGLNPVNAVFVGKNDMESLPLFGFMYKKLHITVDRGSISSRVNTLKKSMQAIDEGKSLVIFPEGGILTKNPPTMVDFKDGAFRVAIEKQIPIVPVTLINIWEILPDEKYMLFRWRPIRMVFHTPIETKQTTLENLPELKQKAFACINETLKQHYPYSVKNL